MHDLRFVLKKIWGGILGVENIKDDDHFFILGGDSMLGSIVVLSIEETLGLEITLLDLYDNPTLKEFVNLVNRKKYK